MSAAPHVSVPASAWGQCANDGLPVSLMRVVCAWCGRDMPAKVCSPEMAGLVSHGMCPDCRDSFSLPASGPSARRVSCAVSSATAGRDRPSLSSAPVSLSPARSSLPGITSAPGVTGPAAPLPEQREHASGGPTGAEELFFLSDLEGLQVWAILSRPKLWAAKANAYLAKCGSMCRWLSVGTLRDLRAANGKGASS